MKSGALLTVILVAAFLITGGAVAYRYVFKGPPLNPPTKTETKRACKGNGPRDTRSVP